MEHKSEALMQTALANGWKAQVKPVIPESGNASEIEWNLYCLRGQETIHVLWVGDRQVEATYAYGDQRKYPARRQGVVDLLTGTPDTRKLRVKTEAEIAELRNVPFLPDSPAMDVLLKLKGTEITWINSITGQAQSATVNVDLKDPRSARNYRVYEAKSGRRLVEWVDAFGFHAVALETIINVL